MINEIFLWTNKCFYGKHVYCTNVIPVLRSRRSLSSEEVHQPSQLHRYTPSSNSAIDRANMYKTFPYWFPYNIYSVFLISVKKTGKNHKYPLFVVCICFKYIPIAFLNSLLACWDCLWLKLGDYIGWNRWIEYSRNPISVALQLPLLLSLQV